MNVSFCQNLPFAQREAARQQRAPKSVIRAEWIDRFMKLPPADARVLELGCGSGRDAEILCSHAVAQLGMMFEGVALMRLAASRWGTPISPDDALFQAFVVPSVNAAFKSLPLAVVKANYFGLRRDLGVLYVENDAPPEILCSHYDGIYTITLNQNLIYHVLNLSRQIFCMPDVMLFWGNAELEPAIEPTFNRYSDFARAEFNFYDANTTDSYQPVSPNREPVCPVRRSGYFALIHQILEFLVIHEFAHIFLGHLELIPQIDRSRFERGERPAQGLTNPSALSEIMADLVAIDWYLGAKMQQFHNTYEFWWKNIAAPKRRLLRCMAPSIAYWAFVSHDVEFSMDIRDHGCTISGFEPEPFRTHPGKTFRLGLINGAIEARLPLIIRSAPLLRRMLSTLADEQAKFAKHLRFYQSDMLADSILRTYFTAELAETGGTLAALFGATEPLRAVPDDLFDWPVRYLAHWLSSSPNMSGDFDHEAAFGSVHG